MELDIVKNKNKEAWKKMNVAIYTRVSTNDQSENWVWLDSQYERIFFEVKHKPDIYAFNKDDDNYVDKWESWNNEHRPELDKMMLKIENWEIDIIMIYKIDRLFRNLLYLLQFIQKVSRLWVIVKSLEDSIDTSDPQSMWKISFMWMVSSIERENIRLRTANWKVTKAKNKFYVWWWKSAFWYDFVEEPGWIKVAINEDEALIVNRIFDMYVKKRKSLWEIARILTVEWIPTKDDAIKNNIRKYNEELDEYKKNADFNASDISYKKWSKKIMEWKWYASSLRKILNNTMYLWYTYYWKTIKEWDNEKKKYIRVENDISEAIKVPSPEILNNTALFNEAQKLLEINKNWRMRKSDYIFTWLIKCWLCPYPHSYFYNWYKTSKQTLSYRCKWSTSKSNHSLDVRCKNPEISETKLFEYAWWELYKKLSNSKNFKWVISNKEKNKEIISELNKKLTGLWKIIQLKEKALGISEKQLYEASDKKSKIRHQNHVNDYLNEIRELEIDEIETKNEINEIREFEKKYNDIKTFNKEHEDNLKEITYDKKKTLMKKFIKEIIRNPWKIDFKFHYLDKLEDNENLANEDKWSIKSDTDLLKKDLSRRFYKNAF